MSYFIFFACNAFVVHGKCIIFAMSKSVKRTINLVQMRKLPFLRHSMVTLLLLALLVIPGALRADNRWTMTDDGGIRWTVGQGQPAHEDHIEMSGRRVSVVLRYGVA
ncbi:MAG: hypothetical protein IJ709_12380, partial [Selenomonas sp.]|nr:hypothetical protein [Selenomonas sp.]